MHLKYIYLQFVKYHIYKGCDRLVKVKYGRKPADSNSH